MGYSCSVSAFTDVPTPDGSVVHVEAASNFSGPTKSLDGQHLVFMDHGDFSLMIDPSGKVRDNDGHTFEFIDIISAQCGLKIPNIQRDTSGVKNSSAISQTLTCHSNGNITDISNIHIGKREWGNWCLNNLHVMAFGLGPLSATLNLNLCLF